MDDLPEEIAQDIFSRVPAETVLECKRVCKTWQNLLSSLDKNFVDMHLHRQQLLELDHGSEVNLGLIIQGTLRNLNSRDHQFYYVKYDERNDSTDDHKEQCIPTFRLIDHSFNRTYDMFEISLVGSCNGLICLTELNKKTGLRDLISISNPITRECLYLPGLIDKHDESFISILSGFGYIPQTNEYKVVRIIYNFRFDRGDIQVYTLGGGGGGRWRNRGVIRLKIPAVYGFFATSVFANGVFANGAIHWLSFERKDIMSFNLLEEKFHVLLTAPVFKSKLQYDSVLGLFGEWLCVHTSESNQSCVNIWTYKQTCSEKNIAGVANNGDETWSWCKEFSITSLDCHYMPFVVTKSGLVLLKHMNNYYPEHENDRYAHTLLCYDPKTATMKRPGIWGFFRAIPHINSFVSLEALGETTLKKRKRDQGSASLIPNDICEFHY